MDIVVVGILLILGLKEEEDEPDVILKNISTSQTHRPIEWIGDLNSPSMD